MLFGFLHRFRFRIYRVYCRMRRALEFGVEVLGLRFLRFLQFMDFIIEFLQELVLTISASRRSSTGA